MKLRENIKKVLNESLREQLISLIDDYGIYQAIRFVGGIDAIIKALKDENGNIPKNTKIKIIGDVVGDKRYRNGDFGGGNDNLYKIEGDNIHYFEYFFKESVEVDVYSEEEERYVDSYDIEYTELSDDNLDKILNTVITYIKEYETD